MNQIADIFEIINQEYDRLRPSERRVADHIRESPEEIAGMSITSLARACSTSEATVNRFCQSLGFAGYPGLKTALTHNLALGSQVLLHGDISDSDELPSVAYKLKQLLVSSLERTHDLVEIASLAKAIDSVIDAKRIYIYGVGGSGYVADFAHHLFLKAGIFTTAYSTGYMQVVSASLLTNRDLVIGISHSGKTKDVVKALSLAKSCGAATIAITGNSHSQIVRHADITLGTYSTEKPIYSDFMEAKVSQIYVISLLYLGVVLTNPTKYAVNLEGSARAIIDRSFRDDEED
jgi:RpiR family transcriptional regulator, carbohydrate utilization regulator